MRLWRICRERYAAAAYAGEGARLYGGRWNSSGLPVVYTSSSLALAAVETFVHLEPNLRPDDLVALEAEMADDIATERLEVKSLPAGWHSRSDESLRAFGDRWVRNGRCVALQVPSAAIRGEWNVLLNPGHADFARVKVRGPQPFEFDLRMFRR
jgi:RES domain-containing protein